jgi:micrococcal nuclease
MGVVDGDTIDVSINGQKKTVRYLLVNTPETVDPRTPIECFGKEASAANKAMVKGKAVYLAKDISETDQFGRTLRYIFTQDAFINAELVKAGYAQVATYPPDVKYEQYLRDLERQAREAKRGLWGPPCNGVTTAPAQPTPKPNPTPRPPTPAPPTGNAKVIIASIYYDGQEPRSEGDEYIVIKNNGSSAVNLQGYSINAGDPGQDFTFPSFVLNPGASVRVYTNRDIAGSFSFNRGSAIWSNDGDCGYLFDPNGNQVSEYCY